MLHIDGDIEDEGWSTTTQGALVPTSILRKLRDLDDVAACHPDQVIGVREIDRKNHVIVAVWKRRKRK